MYGKGFYVSACLSYKASVSIRNSHTVFLRLSDALKILSAGG
jgi:hypothetical protein